MISNISMATLALKFSSGASCSKNNSPYVTSSFSPNFGTAQDKFVKAVSLEDAIKALSSSFKPGEVIFSCPELDKKGVLGQMSLRYKAYSKDNHAISLDFTNESGKPNGHQTLSLGEKSKVQEDLQNPDFIIRIQNSIEDFVTKHERSNS